MYSCQCFVQFFDAHFVIKVETFVFLAFNPIPELLIPFERLFAVLLFVLLVCIVVGFRLLLIGLRLSVGTVR